MTEAEWLTSDDPAGLLKCLPEGATDRKLRLFCLVCCERIASHIGEPRSRAAIEFLERHYDMPHSRRKGIAAVRTAAMHGHRELYMKMLVARATMENAKALVLSNAANAAYEILARDPRWAAEYTAAFAVHSFTWDWLVRNRPEVLPEYDRSVGLPERQRQAELLRDIVGNPFRPVVFSPEWRSSTAVSLAQHIYESRDFSPMPILADALQDAGCDNDHILTHCRDANATHVRGCWVVDLVLGKT